ncbi:MAG TPA: RNA methyltransferase [Pyrinomonadaceae bacterium]|nr:RNA methyltransferase [Pyrinomonadaceae bacterium]
MQTKEVITSRSNSRLKFARKVREGLDKNFIFVEGQRLVNEALRFGLEVSALFVDIESKDKEGIKEIIQRAENNGFFINLLSKQAFQSISDTVKPQGVAIIGKRPVFSIETFGSKDLITTPVPAIYLFEINNPSNLGAIIRAAAAAGAAAVFTSAGSCDSFSPKALRAGMGAHFRIPIFENVGIDELSRKISQDKMQIAAADAKGEQSYLQIDWRKIGLVIFGSEAFGLEKINKSLNIEKFRIEMENDIESLNLAVAAGVVLFEAKNKRQINSNKK